MGRMMDHHRRVASTCILVLGLTSTQLDYTWLGPTSGFPIHGSSLAGLGLNAKSNVAISSQELVPLYLPVLRCCTLKGQKEMKV